MQERDFEISDTLSCWLRLIWFNFVYGLVLAIPIGIVFLFIHISIQYVMFLILFTGYISYFLALQKTLSYRYKKFRFAKTFNNLSHYKIIGLYLISNIIPQIASYTIGTLNLLFGTGISLISSLICIWLFIRFNTKIVDISNNKL